jgi:hypothetical protein
MASPPFKDLDIKSMYLSILQSGIMPTVIPLETLQLYLPVWRTSTNLRPEWILNFLNLNETKLTNSNRPLNTLSQCSCQYFRIMLTVIPHKTIVKNVH